MSSDALNRKFVHVPGVALFASLGLHILVPILLVLVGAISSWSIFTHRMASPDPYQNFIQVDVVDLPDQVGHEKVDLSAPLNDRNQHATTPDPALPESKVMTMP